MLYQIDNVTSRDFFQCNKVFCLQSHPHLHRNFELIYVIKGFVVINSNCGSEKIQAGEYALIFTNAIHSYETPEYSEVYCCQFSGDLIHPFVKKIRGSVAENTKFKCSKTVEEFITEILFVENSKPDWYLLKSAIYAVVGEYRKTMVIHPFDGATEDAVAKVLHYVEEHYVEDITLSHVSEVLGYERHYLSRCVHKHVNMNFSQIVNWYRVEAATELLQNTNLSMTQIALESGFQSIRNFNRVYFKLTGRTPLQAAKGFSRQNDTNG